MSARRPGDSLGFCSPHLARRLIGAPTAVRNWPVVGGVDHCASLNHHRNCTQEVSFISSCHPALPFLLPFLKTPPRFNLHSNPFTPQLFGCKPRHLTFTPFQLQTSFSRQTSLCQLSKISKPLVSLDLTPLSARTCPQPRPHHHSSPIHHLRGIEQ